MGAKLTFRELKKQCDKYYKKEPREIFYKYAIKFVKSNNFEKKIDGISILLLSWNMGFYQRGKKGKFSRRKLKKLIKSSSKDLKSLNGNFLEKLNFKRKEKIIIRLFKKFSKNENLGPTGASKALHLLNPELFVMWDSKIRTNYNKNKRGESYLKFMKKEKGRIENIRNLSRIVKKLNNKEYRRGIPKLLDEYNYAKKRLWDKTQLSQ